MKLLSINQNQVRQIFKQKLKTRKLVILILNPDSVRFDSATTKIKINLFILLTEQLNCMILWITNSMK